MSSLGNKGGSIITLCFMFLFLIFFSKMWFDISAAMQTRVNPVALSVPREAATSDGVRLRFHRDPAC